MIMVIKTVVTLWVAISSATWIGATSEEDTIPRKWLKPDSFHPELFPRQNPALYDEHGPIDPFVFPTLRVIFASTPRPEQVPSLVAPPVQPEPVSHPTPPLVPNPPTTPAENLPSKESTSPPPSSTTENDLPEQLSPPSSHVMGNRPSEETPFSEVSTTEESIFEGKSSSAHTDKDFVSEELESSLALFVGEEITSKKIEPPTKVLAITIIIAGIISAVVLLTILLICIQDHWHGRKIAETKLKQYNEHSHIVYQTTVQVI